MIETILAGIGIGSIVGKTISDMVTDSKMLEIQKDNLAFQEENLNYQRAVQQKTWSHTKIMQYNAVLLI